MGDDGEKVPTAIAHFVIEGVLGSGGMGVVYRARDKKLGRLVALKVLRPETVDDPRRRKRFLNEARAAAAVRHPCIATVYEIGVEPDGEIYIAMEWVDGRTLNEIVTREGPLGTRRARRVLLQVAKALASAHDAGVIHRDLKDDNIMETADGDIKLLDFGIAKQRDIDEIPPSRAQTADAVTIIGVPIGTPGFMSPEQARGDTVDHRTDVFAFGVVMTKILSGRLPFRGGTRVELTAAPLQQDPDTSDVPAPFRSLAQRCLARAVDDRFPDAHALVAALDAIVLAETVDRTESGIRDDAPPMAQRETRHASTGWRVVGLMMVVAGVVALVWIMSTRSASPDAPTVASTSPARPQSDPRRLRHETLVKKAPELGTIAGAISPDGQRLAFAVTTGVFVRDIPSGAERKIAANPGAELTPIDWLAADNRLLCRAAGDEPGLVTLSLTDGSRRPLYAPAFMGAVSPDGTKVAVAAADGLHLVAIDQTSDRLMLSLPKREAQALGMQWSNSGERLLILRPVDGPDGQTVRVETIALSGDSTPKLAFEAPAIVGQTAYRAALWFPDGRVVVAVTEPPPNNLISNFWETTVDPDTGEGGGPLRRLTNWPDSGLWYTSASRDGRRVALTMLQANLSVVVAELGEDRKSLAGPPQRVTSDLSRHWPSGWQDDDTVIYSSNQGHKLDVFAHRVGEDQGSPLLAGPEHDTYATRLSNDALLHFRFAWNEDKNGITSRLLVTDDDGSRELLVGPLETGRFTFGNASPIAIGVRCTPDRTQCVIGERSQGAFVISALDTTAGRGDQLASTTDQGGIVSWDIAPDGKRIALLEARLDLPTSVMRIFERGAGHRDIALDRSCSPTGIDWARDDELFITCYDNAGHALLRLGLDGKTAELYRSETATAELWQPHTSPDGRFVAYREDVTIGSMWLVEGW